MNRGLFKKLLGGGVRFGAQSFAWTVFVDPRVAVGILGEVNCVLPPLESGGVGEVPPLESGGLGRYLLWSPGGWGGTSSGVWGVGEVPPLEPGGVGEVWVNV